MGLYEIIKGEQPGIITSIFNYKNRGQFGEFAIEYALTNSNLNGELIVLKNIYVPCQGRTSEIDLLMIHEKGIFVFESKNYSGWIFGTSEQLNWTQSLHTGEKHRFYNPIRQNRTHIKALSTYLNIPISSFVSVIVFSERCKLKNVPKSTNDTIIVQRPNMLKKIRTCLKVSSIQYSHEEIALLKQKLQPLTIISASQKEQHIHLINNNCPLCGRELILRYGKHGKFWGCTAYPKCIYTRQL